MAEVRGMLFDDTCPNRLATCESGGSRLVLDYLSVDRLPIDSLRFLEPRSPSVSACATQARPRLPCSSNLEVHSDLVT